MAEKINLTIGKNIRIYRKRYGWTQKYLGARIGVAAQQLQKYEAATNTISASKVIALADIFQCSVSDILYDTQDSIITSTLGNIYLQELVNDFMSTSDSPALQEHIVQIVHIIAKTHHKQRKARAG